MFRIIKAGAGIGLTENLNYIKKAENGCYILCPEHDASGIVFEGVAYHLLGRKRTQEPRSPKPQKPVESSLSPWRKPGALTPPRRLNTLICSLNGLSLWPTR